MGREAVGRETKRITNVAIANNLDFTIYIFVYDVKMFFFILQSECEYCTFVKRMMTLVVPVNILFKLRGI